MSPVDNVFRKKKKNTTVVFNVVAVRCENLNLGAQCILSVTCDLQACPSPIPRLGTKLPFLPSCPNVLIGITLFIGFC